MRTSINGGARVIDAIGVVLWGTATYGQYSSRGATKSLTSFCGFKAGEIKKSDKGIQESIRARTPFRRFRDVRLEYTPNGKLYGVCAHSFFDKMKPDAAKKELELCCAEFGRYGISFPKKWTSSDGGNLLQKLGRGDWGTEVHVRGILATTRWLESGKKMSGASIDILVRWNGFDWYTITPKLGNYNPQRKLTRREFIEQVIGVKLESQLQSEINGSVYEQNAMVNTSVKLVPSLLGMASAEIKCSKSTKEVKGINLYIGKCDLIQDSAAAKKECIKMCDRLKKWLCIDALAVEEETSDTLVHASSAFEDESIRVDVDVTGTRDVEWSSCNVRFSLPTGDARPKMFGMVRKNTSDQRTANVVSRMKAMILPDCTFRPPATMADVVFFMNKKGRELDTRNVPDDKRGFNFVLKTPPGKTRTAIPDYSASDISLWRALTELCKIAKPEYKFEVDRWGVIVVKPKAPSSN